MIRVIVVDDHPALRAGLRTVIDGEPGIVFAGESDGGEETLWPLLDRARPDLVLLDYHLPHADGFQLCHRIKARLRAPKVVVYSAYASPALALPARLAHADGLIDKGLGARELFEAIRRVHSGERLLPEVSRTMLGDAYDRLRASDQALIGMLLGGATERDAAGAVGDDARLISQQMQRILGTLRLEVPTPSSW
jgi:DNA-binding NarL/FixJ family response regulator